ncbi:MAG: DUF488 domain-containing protein [Candidatus Acidiferrales bacterium]
MTSTSVLTIGHSNHSLEKLVQLLNGHGVTAVADVRSSPYSRANPQFNREFLQEKLKDNGIAYVFLGRELGARPADPAFYENGRVQYRRLSQSAPFQEGLDRVMKGAASFNLALLCAEREPLVCHRTLLVARELVARGVPVTHIHADATLETHDEAMNRLIQLLGMPEKDLYRNREEIISDACAIQEQRVAYVDEDLHKEASA